MLNLELSGPWKGDANIVSRMLIKIKEKWPRNKYKKHFPSMHVALGSFTSIGESKQNPRQPMYNRNAIVGVHSPVLVQNKSQVNQ